jgi:hypothetical protein
MSNPDLVELAMGVVRQIRYEPEGVRPVAAEPVADGVHEILELAPHIPIEIEKPSPPAREPASDGLTLTAPAKKKVDRGRISDDDPRRPEPN